MKDFDIYLNFLKEIETFEKNNKFKIFDIFVSFLENEKTQEAYYLLNNMIDQNLIEPKIIIQKLQYPYFVQSRFIREILLTSEELSKNDWELHKQLIHVGINPNEIAKIIRNDELEKLQEISSQENFDFNQVIKPSVYERCNFINQSKVSLIDYAAFFGSVKCFKYLLMNNTNVENTGKYAVAGGNEEIIHLCEQNHSSFKGAYETAIKYHRNDIFKYIYENKIENIKIKINNLPYFGRICIIYHNYDILLYLIDKGMKINDFLINESIKIGNLYLLKYFHKFKQLPKDILLSSVGPKAVKNVEIVEYILNQKGNNINIKDICLF